MEDIFSTSFDSDYHFLGFSKSELDMDTAGSGKVNEEIKTDRTSRSRIRSRSRDPHSKHGRDYEYKERCHKRDKPTQEQIPPSRRCSSMSSSFLSDNRQAAESRLRPKQSSVLYHAKSRSVCGVIRMLCMTEAEVIKEDIATIRNKAPKQVKGMHPNRSQLSDYGGRKVS